MVPRGLLLGGLFYEYSQWMLVGCYEDKTLIETRKTFNSEINKMQREFGQMAIYPEVKITMRGNIYSIEF